MKSDLAVRDGGLVENWYILCLSRELNKKPLRREIYDTPYVVYRNETQKPVVFLDRCLHRHAQLSEGVVIDGKLACPYHGWTYNSEGVVVCVPSEGPKGLCEHAHLQTKAIPVVEQDGCVWIWTGQRKPESATPPFRYPHSGDKSYCRYFMITDFENEVTHLAENFMDVPHTVFVHAGWFRNPSKTQVPITVTTKNGSVLVDYKQEQDKIGFTSFVLNPKNEPMKHTDLFIMPNLTRVDYNFGNYNSFVIISQCTPVSKLKSRVYTEIIFRIWPVTKLLKQFMQFYTRRVIEQDVVIMANQSKNFWHDMNCRFHHTDADIVHESIEKLRDMGVKGDPTFKNIDRVEEKTIWI